MDWNFELEMLLRIIVSGVCGLLIGYERKNRGKEAGIRTHIIVALSSALMMILSKYAYFDLINGVKFPGAEVKLDPSRVAAGIVSSVGFLGAGMIFVHKKTVTGLTTAAGIWATCGIGMAIGGGLYFIGISSALLIVLIQILLHKNLGFLRQPTFESLIMTMNPDHDTLNRILNYFEMEEIHVEDVELKRLDNGMMEMRCDLELPKGYEKNQLVRYAAFEDGVKTVQI